MQQNRIPILGLICTGFLKGLVYALAFGFPLYCCCALWFGVVFPQQNFTISTGLFFTFVGFILVGLALLFRGYWLLGAKMTEKAGTIVAGVTTSGWAAAVALVLLWQISLVSSVLGGPVVKHPGNPIRGIALFGGFYLLTPFSVLVGGVVFGGLGGEAGAKKAEQQHETSP